MGRLDSHDKTTEQIDYSVLVQAEQGLVSRRIFIDPDIYAAGTGAGVRALLAVSVPRKPVATARRLLLHLHGRRPGAGHAQPKTGRSAPS